jgi:hypothetical protein
MDPFFRIQPCEKKYRCGCRNKDPGHVEAVPDDLSNGPIVQAEANPRLKDIHPMTMPSSEFRTSLKDAAVGKKIPLGPHPDDSICLYHRQLIIGLDARQCTHHDFHQDLGLLIANRGTPIHDDENSRGLDIAMIRNCSCCTK